MPGVGLLILRFAVAANAIVHGVKVSCGSWPVLSPVSLLGFLDITLGLALIAGLLTPVMSFILAVEYFIHAACLIHNNGASKYQGALMSVHLALTSIAIAFLGPGAFSVDARLFGRLEIIIPERRRPPF